MGVPLVGKGMRLEVGCRWKEGVCKQASRRAVRQSRLRLFRRQGFSAATARLSRLRSESQSSNTADGGQRRTEGEEFTVRVDIDVMQSLRFDF